VLETVSSLFCSIRAQLHNPMCLAHVTMQKTHS